MERTSNDKYSAIMVKQRDQIRQLKDELSHLRDQYSDMKREYQLQTIRVQRQISSTQKKSRAAEERLRALRASLHNSKHAQMANEIVQRIWSIIASHRQEQPLSTSESSPIPDNIPDDSPIPESSGSTFSLTPACESIASRRTRRSSTANVYYKEPSLRSALTPGDPYTFSLEDGIVTPTIPDGYTRTRTQSSRKLKVK